VNAPIAAELSLALSLSLERSRCDLAEALALLRAMPGGDALDDVQHLLARAINRLEMMRMALGRREDGPVLT